MIAKIQWHKAFPGQKPIFSQCDMTKCQSWNDYLSLMRTYFIHRISNNLIWRRKLLKYRQDSAFSVPLKIQRNHWWDLFLWFLLLPLNMRGSITHRNLTSLPVLLRSDKTHLIGVVMLSLLALMAFASMMTITMWFCFKSQRLSIFNCLKRLKCWLCGTVAANSRYELILEKKIVSDCNLLAKNSSTNEESFSLRQPEIFSSYDGGICNPLFDPNDQS